MVFVFKSAFILAMLQEVIMLLKTEWWNKQKWRRIRSKDCQCCRNMKEQWCEHITTPTPVEITVEHNLRAKHGPSSIGSQTHNQPREPLLNQGVNYMLSQMITPWISKRSTDDKAIKSTRTIHCLECRMDGGSSSAWFWGEVRWGRWLLLLPTIFANIVMRGLSAKICRWTMSIKTLGGGSSRSCSSS